MLSPDELVSRWQQACDLSRTRVATALVDGTMDTPGRHLTRDGESPRMRRILGDPIEGTPATRAMPT